MYTTVADIDICLSEYILLPPLKKGLRLIPFIYRYKYIKVYVKKKD